MFFIVVVIVCLFVSFVCWVGVFCLLVFVFVLPENEKFCAS